MFDRFRSDLWLTHIYGYPQKYFLKSTKRSTKAWKGVSGVEGVASAMEGNSHVKISQPEYRCPHFAVKLPKRENKVGRGRKASANN